MLYRVIVNCLLTLTLYACLTPLAHSNLPPFPQKEHITFRHVDFSKLSENQSSIRSIEIITQDRHGFLWVGGLNGLARFDGYDVKFYRHSSFDSNSISSDDIRDIVIDKAGVMWVATSAGLSQYDENSDSFINGFNLKSVGLNMAISEVRALDVTPENHLVIGTHKGLVLLDADRKNSQIFFHQENDPNSLSSSHITDVLYGSDGTIWAATVKGLNTLNTNTGKIQRYLANENNPFSIADNHITTLHKDTRGQIWIGFYNGGVDRLDTSQGVFHRLTSPYLDRKNSLILDINERSDGSIWIAADHIGLISYDPKTNSHTLYTHDDSNPQTLDSNQVRAIFEDKQNDLWIGSFTGTLNHYSKARSVFRNYSIASNESDGLNNKAVLAIAESTDGKIWIGTEGGLNKFDPNTQKFKHLSVNSNSKGLLPYAPVTSIEIGPLNRLWLGTWSAGLISFDRATQNFKQFLPNKKDPNAIIERSLWDIEIGSEGDLWLGGDTGGLSRFNIHTQKFHVYQPEPNEPYSVPWRIVRKVIYRDSETLWLLTPRGLCIFNPIKGQCREKIPHLDTKQLLNNVMYSGLISKAGDLWIGTEGGGINVLRKGSEEFEIIGIADGLPNLNVPSLIEDQDGNIWAGTLNGLAKLNPRPPYNIKTYKQHHGLIGHSINRNSLYFSSDNRVYVGTTEGLSIFDPNTLSENTIQGQVYITEFNIATRGNPDKLDVKPRTSYASHLHQPINLKHSENAFSFTFSSLQFQSPRLANYQYRLKGFEEDWKQADRSRTASYTNIDPGHYLFEVRRGDSQEQPNAQTTIIPITITPPIWQTWWAYLVYLVSFVCIGYWLVQQRTAHLKREREIQKNLNLKLVKLDKLKSDFLASTSHELRTPLNGIIGIAESLEHALRDIDLDLQDQAAMILASGKRLSSMVNSVLDFSSISEDRLNLNLRPENIFLAAESALDIMRAQAQSKGLAFENKIGAEGTMVLADRERLQQIFLNLLSNAIKYTAKGKITISCRIENSEVRVDVTDTGQGIPKNALKHIFSAFNQLEEVETRAHQGAGLGLALTKKLVELHHGNIQLDSSIRVGTTVSFTLKLATRDAIKANLIRTHQPKNHVPTHSNAQTNGTDKSNLNSETKKTEINFVERARTEKTVLVVDDDTINRMVLRGLLKFCQCQIEEASNGYEAIKRVKANQDIDLIILDIMMPEMSGIEVCKRIRENYSKEELPIIFLSAKTTEDTESECLQAGGNLYLTKPITKSSIIPIIEEYIR